VRSFADGVIDDQIATMIEDHPFTFSVEPHTMGYYRWTIQQGRWARDISLQPYATQEEAAAAATQTMSKLIAHWQTRQMTSKPRPKR
jgi:hypothetical protein